MNALDNGIPASTVGLIYTSNYVQHLHKFSWEKKVLLFCLNISLKALKQENWNWNSDNSNKDLPHLLLSLRVLHQGFRQ